MGNSPPWPLTDMHIGFISAMFISLQLPFKQTWIFAGGLPPPWSSRLEFLDWGLVYDLCDFVIWLWRVLGTCWLSRDVCILYHTSLKGVDKRTARHTQYTTSSQQFCTERLHQVYAQCFQMYNTSKQSLQQVYSGFTQHVRHIYDRCRQPPTQISTKRPTDWQHRFKSEM